MAYVLLGAEGYNNEQDTGDPLLRTHHREQVEMHQCIVCKLPLPPHLRRHSAEIFVDNSVWLMKYYVQELHW